MDKQIESMREVEKTAAELHDEVIELCLLVDQYLNIV